MAQNEEEKYISNAFHEIATESYDLCGLLSIEKLNAIDGQWIAEKKGCKHCTDLITYFDRHKQ